MFDHLKKNMKKFLFATLVISYGLWSCKGGGDSTDDPPVVKTLCDSVTYNTMVKKIFTDNCNLAGCHSQGAGNVDLRTYNKAKEAAQTKEMVKAINFELDVNKNMPQGKPKMSQRNIDIIECWINKGYPE